MRCVLRRHACYACMARIEWMMNSFRQQLVAVLLLSNLAHPILCRAAVINCLLSELPVTIVLGLITNGRRPVVS